MTGQSTLRLYWFFPVAGLVLAGLGAYLWFRFKPREPGGFVCFTSTQGLGRTLLSGLGQMLFIGASMVTLIFLFLFIYDAVTLP